MTVTYVSEGASGPATLADAQVWANDYSHKGLVTISDYQDVYYPFVDGSFNIVLPGIILIGPKMKIAKMTEPTIQEIELVSPGP
jgi:hypothetical protein